MSKSGSERQGQRTEQEMDGWQLFLAFAAAYGGVALLYQIGKTLDEMNKRMKRMVAVMEEMNNRENVKQWSEKYRDVKVTWTKGLEDE